MFDKTGTLTMGKPGVASARHIDVVGLRQAAIREKRSTEHNVLSSTTTPAAETSDVVEVLLDIEGMRCMKNCGTPVQNVLREADLSALGAFQQKFLAVATASQHVLSSHSSSVLCLPVVFFLSRDGGQRCSC